MEPIGVVSRMWVWLVGGLYGCGYLEVGVVRMYRCGYGWCCKEVLVYTFPHKLLLIPTLLVLTPFYRSIRTSFLF